MKKPFETALPILIALALGALIFTQFIQPKLNHTPAASDTTVSNETAEFFATQLMSAEQTLQSLDQYKGKTLIVNFWATWCPPCREEMPDLSALHEKLVSQNVLVLGLAVDELDAVQSFQAESPVSYPLLIAVDEGMALASQLGNHKGVLPFTAIINPQGKVSKAFYGKVNQEMLLNALDL